MKRPIGFCEKVSPSPTTGTMMEGVLWLTPQASPRDLNIRYRVTHLQSPPGTRTIHDMGSRDFHNNKSCVFLWCRFWPSRHQDVNPAPFTAHIGSRAKGDLHKTLTWNIITIYWHYAFKSTPNIGKDSQHQTLPQMCPIKQEFMNKVKC